MTHPQFRIETLHERSRERTHRIKRGRLLAAEQTRGESADQGASLRLVSDDRILERLAALESREAPQGRHLLAEVDGEAVAALSLVTGEFLADPFRPTAHLRPLMHRHAAQLNAPTRPRWAPVLFDHRFAR
jgi:hypothetical protein